MLSLAGRKVLVTRTWDDSVSLVSRLERAGAEAVVLPCISVEPFEDDSTRARLVAAFKRATWVAFTSRRGVEVVRCLDVEISPETGIAVVGRRTEKRAVSCFGRCDLIAAEGTGGSLGRDLVHAATRIGAVGSTVVVVPGAETGRRDLESELAKAGIEVVEVSVYRTLPVEIVAEPVDLAEMGIDTVILASPSAAVGLLNQARVPHDMRIVTIGPTTSEAVRKAGLTVAAEASTPSAEALFEVIR